MLSCWFYTGVDRTTTCIRRANICDFYTGFDRTTIGCSTCIRPPSGRANICDFYTEDDVILQTSIVLKFKWIEKRFSGFVVLDNPMSPVTTARAPCDPATPATSAPPLSQPNAKPSNQSKREMSDKMRNK